MTKFLDGLYTVIKYVCIVIFGISVILGVSQVVTRYVFSISFPSSEEINRYLFVWVVMLGSALVMRDKSHAAITILIMHIPACLGKALRVFVHVIIIGFLGLLIYQGWKMALVTHMQPAAATGLPMSYAYLSIPIGALCMLLFALEMCYKEFFSGNEEFEVFDEEVSEQ